MENNTNNNQTSEKKTSNRFKQAAERQKVAPGGNGAQPSQEQVNAPLSFTAPAVTQVPEVTIPEPKEEEKLDLAAILQSRYADARYQRVSEEGRTKAFQALLKPSVSERLTKDVNKKKIKSRNDLINFLLEEYYGIHADSNK